MFFNKKKVYLDYAAATPVLPEVRKTMEKYWTNNFYNTNAIYNDARKVSSEVEDARGKVAKLVGAAKENVFFTAGGTESLQRAIFGGFEAALEKMPGKKPHIIISAVEHPAVVDAALEIERRGGRVSVLPVDAFGRVDTSKLQELLKPNTFLVSVMLANNEIGTMEPVAKLGRIVKEFRKERESEFPYLHTDASQCPSYIKIDLEALQADMLTLDGAKIYGPKSSGVLILRRGVKIRGLDTGTENPALIAGFTKAFEIAQEEREREARRMIEVKKHFLAEVRGLKDVIINTPDDSLPNIVSISVPGVLAELIVLALDKEGVMISSGSACSADERTEGSPVIHAIGKPELSTSTLRFSFGRGTDKKQVELGAKHFCAAVEHVRIES